LAPFPSIHKAQRRSSWMIDRVSLRRRIDRKIRSTIIVFLFFPRTGTCAPLCRGRHAVLGLLEFLKDAGSLAVASSLGKPSGRLESGVHLSTGRIEKWLKHQSCTRRPVPMCAVSRVYTRVFHCYYFHPGLDVDSVHPWSSSSFVVVFRLSRPLRLHSSSRSSSSSACFRRLRLRFRLRLRNDHRSRSLRCATSHEGRSYNSYVALAQESSRLT